MYLLQVPINCHLDAVTLVRVLQRNRTNRTLSLSLSPPPPPASPSLCVCVCVCVIIYIIRNWLSLNQKAREYQCPVWKTGREWIHLSSAFCSILAFNRLNEAHPHWGRTSALLSLLIQMLISSRNILIDTRRNNVEPNIWAFGNQVKLTHKINHHRCSPTPLCSLLYSLVFTQSYKLYFYKLTQIKSFPDLKPSNNFPVAL